METVVLTGQSLLDVAIQTGGSVEAVISLAVANNISITDALMPGQTLETGDIINTDITNYYAVKGIKPATDEIATESRRGGIGHMGIGIDFIVSPNQ